MTKKGENAVHCKKQQYLCECKSCVSSYHYTCSFVRDTGLYAIIVKPARNKRKNIHALIQCTICDFTTILNTSAVWPLLL